MTATFRSRPALTMLLCFWLGLVLWAPYGFLEARQTLNSQSNSSATENQGSPPGPPPGAKSHPGSDVPAARGDYPRIRSSAKASVGDEEPSTGAARLLNGVFITVKTGRQNHRVRLPAILETWFQLARQQTFFFTDAEDADVSRASGDRLENTGCPPGHTRRALSCKMNSEFDAFVLTDNKWWCHFDDDSYVNVVALGKMLSSFNASDLWYLGRPSIQTPIELTTKKWGTVRFRFATGGAGFCISRALANEMKPHAFKGRLEELSEELRLPDDVTIGFLVEVIVGAKLTALLSFHSHLEEMRLVQRPLRNHISLSYNLKRTNFVLVKQRLRRDSTRFLSIHCEIFPTFPTCNRFRRRR